MNNARILITSAAGKTGMAAALEAGNHGNGARASREVRGA